MKTSGTFVRAALCLLLSVLHLVLISGCTTKEQITYHPAELNPSLQAKILIVVLKSGELVRFDAAGGNYIETERNGRLYRGIVGITADGRAVDVDLESASEVRLERTEVSTAGTIVLIALGVPAVLFAALLVSLTINPPHSCPYVYSFDGERYAFDGQTYAGAITRALKRPDVTRLDLLRPVDGRYHLLLRNDPANEVQYTDLVKLLAVDHRPEEQVVFGYDGTPHVFAGADAPIAVRDAAGRDVTRYFALTDGLVWQSELPLDTSYRNEPLRELLTFTFPRPPDTGKARLLVHGGSAFWGSTMIERFISLRGSSVPDWYAALEARGPVLEELRRIGEGQELYHLRVEVWEKNGWVTWGVIHSGSSLADEERVIPLDLRNAETEPGNAVRIRIRPPRGFWKFDGIRLAARELPVFRVTELDPVRGEDDGGAALLDLLRTEDENYYVQRKPMETLRLWFDVPPQPASTARSLFLKTAGYYLIFPDTGHAERTEVVRRLTETDSSAVRFALDEWFTQHGAALSTARHHR